MSFHLYFNILRNHPHHMYFKMNVNHLYFLFEEYMMKSLNLQTHIYLVKTPPYIFSFIFLRFMRFFPTRPPTWNTLILRHPV
jgi:hypothetical protein